MYRIGIAVNDEKLLTYKDFCEMREAGIDAVEISGQSKRTSSITIVFA